LTILNVPELLEAPEDVQASQPMVARILLFQTFYDVSVGIAQFSGTERIASTQQQTYNFLQEKHFQADNAVLACRFLLCNFAWRYYTSGLLLVAVLLSMLCCVTAVTPGMHHA
jgi:hypothetical protein